jgi:hypothetical protein
MATAYGVAAPNGALFTADPGTWAPPPASPPGSPAYARKAMSWAPLPRPRSRGPVRRRLGRPLPLRGQRGTAGTYYDGVGITSQAFASQGTYAVTPTYTQT